MQILKPPSSIVVFFTVLLFFILPPNFILLDFSSSNNINTSVTQFLVFAFISIISFRYKYSIYSNFQRFTFFIYIIFAVYFFVLSFTVYYSETDIQSKIIRVQVKNIIFGLVTLQFLWSKRVGFEAVLTSIRKIGILFSVLSLILYIGVAFNIIPLVSKYHADINEVFQRGWYLGYVNVIVNGVPRNQFYFTEAAQFAQFLQVPLGISIIQYFNKKNISNLFGLIIIGCALILTFSLANIFGWLIAYTLVALIGSLSVNANFFKRVFFITTIVGSIYTFKIIYDISNLKTGSTVISKSSADHIDDRGDRIDFALDLANTSFFGDFKYRKSFGSYVAHNNTAFGNLAVEGGVPALIVFPFFLIFFWVTFIKKTINIISDDYIIISFVAFFIGNLWYGNWMNYSFIFSLGIMIRYMENNRRLKLR